MSAFTLDAENHAATNMGQDTIHSILKNLDRVKFSHYFLKTLLISMCHNYKEKIDKLSYNFLKQNSLESVQDQLDTTLYKKAIEQILTQVNSSDNTLSVVIQKNNYNHIYKNVFELFVYLGNSPDEKKIFLLRELFGVLTKDLDLDTFNHTLSNSKIDLNFYQPRLLELEAQELNKIKSEELPQGKKLVL